MLTAPERAAVEAVTTGEVVALLRDLITVESSETEEEVIRLLEARLAAEGLEPRRDPVAPGRDNLLVGLGPAQGGRTLILSAHMDTVPVGHAAAWSVPPLGGVIRDGRVFGRGATDCKGGLAAMVMAVAALWRARVPLQGGVLLTCVAGETHGNLGTLALADRGLRGDFAIVGEYSEGDKIATTYRGGLWGRLVIHGRSAHPGRPHLGADAIRAALDALLPALRGYRFRFAPHPLVPDPALTVTQLEAGRRRSTIADHCAVTFDIRLVPGQDHREVWRDLEALVGEAAGRLPGIRASLEPLYALDAFETSADHPDVRVLAGCIQEVTGRPPAVMGKVGMCDGNVLVHRLGIPSVAYGPGNPSGAAVDEHCEIRALEWCTRAYVLAAMRLPGVGPAGGP